MVNILVAIRTWGRAWTGKTLLVHCDNAAVVSVLTTGLKGPHTGSHGQKYNHGSCQA